MGADKRDIEHGGRAMAEMKVLEAYEFDAVESSTMPVHLAQFQPRLVTSTYAVCGREIRTAHGAPPHYDLMLLFAVIMGACYLVSVWKEWSK